MTSDESLGYFLSPSGLGILCSNLWRVEVCSFSLEENPQTIDCVAWRHRFDGGGVQGNADEGAGVSGAEAE